MDYTVVHSPLDAVLGRLGASMELVLHLHFQIKCNLNRPRNSNETVNSFCARQWRAF